MLKFQILLVLMILPMLVIPSFANASSAVIITADNDLIVPGCGETEVGCYTPSSITVELGTPLIMINNDTEGIHTFTSGTVDGFAPSPDGIFDSGILQFGDSYEWIVDVEGEIAYYDMLHVWMQGMIIVVDTLEHIEIEVETDKSEYVEDDLIVISGTVSEIVDDLSVTLQIIHDGLYAHLSQLQVSSDGSFIKTVLAEGVSWQEEGEYTVRVYYNYVIAETVFNYSLKEIPPPAITIQTDKDHYYLDHTIYINGTISSIDSADPTITYNVYYSDGKILEKGDGGIFSDDGIFNFTINTSDNELWDDKSDYMKITVSIQDYTAFTFFNYYNTPDMANEVLYRYIMNNNSTISIHDYMMDGYDTILSTQNNTITLQTEIINSLREDMVILIALVEELIGTPPPIPADAPIIISLIVDDPDDLDDVYSVGDTITILFDSNTNEPGGTGTQTKSKVNDLFTFTESIGQAYSGKWVTPDTFTITINSISSVELIINYTTVTPTGIKLIYPADGTLDASHMTSPVLSGDFGIP